MFFYRTLIVYENQIALIYKNGRLVKTVGAGKYRLWGWHRHTAVFDTRTTSVTIPCQEILTKDQVPVRITVAVTYEIGDPVKANHVVDDYENQLYLDVQLALREHVAELTFDELLEQKSQIGEALQAAVHEAAARYGVNLKRAGIKDVTMPGNVREMMLKKIEAEKSAQASLIRAREEVAAARARVNVARMITDNPAVLRLKELETMSDLAKSPGNTIVFAGRTEIDGLLAQAVNGSAK